jgi:LmbE family N-acetylglucosaminyl deacetylase
MSRLLIISPHLDDAVLSCGARIATTTESGGEAIVATCFTTPGGTAPEELKQLYDRRKADDGEALKMLGAGFRHLGFTDAPSRNPQYHNFNTILFHHHLPDEETTLVLQLTATLEKLIGELKPDELVFPLGTGGHIDHHLVWESSKTFWNRSCIVSFYEDLPYALVPGWNAVRWNQLGMGTEESGQNRRAQENDGQTVDRQVGNSDSYDQNDGAVKMDLPGAPFPFVHNYMSSSEDRRLSMEKYDKEYEGLEHDLWNAHQWTFNGKVFVRTLYKANARNFNTKCQAITNYSSEWPVLFGPDEQNIREMLTYPGNPGDYTEISWTLKTKR